MTWHFDGHSPHILPANGIRCDFRERDQPPPEILVSTSTGYAFGNEAAEMGPLLDRAIIVGAVDLVRVLLANEAEVNGGYHNLDRSYLNKEGNSPEVIMSCGRDA